MKEMVLYEKSLSFSMASYAYIWTTVFIFLPKKKKKAIVII